MGIPDKSPWASSLGEFLYKVAYFLLMTTSTVLFSKESTRCLSFSSYLIASEEMSTESDLMKLQGRFVAKAIAIVSQVSELAQLTRSFQLVRNLEMAVLFFLETFSLNSLSNVEFEVQTKTLKCNSAVFSSVGNSIESFPDILSFLQIVFNKSLSNLEFKDLTLDLYSLFVLKTLLHKIKQLVPRDFFKKMGCVQFLREKIPSINFTALGDFQFSKARTVYFEIVASTYFDDYLDDFRDEILRIFSQILQANLQMAEPREQLFRFFRDLNGILNGIELGKIFQLFHRITFPSTLSLVAANSETIQKDEKVLCALLDFLNSYMDNRLTRLSQDTYTGLPYILFTEISKVITSQLSSILTIFNQGELTQPLVERQ